MELKPSKVVFNEKAYKELENNIKKLESDYKQEQEKSEQLRTITELFFRKLSEVMDISQCNIDSDSYNLQIINDQMSDKIRLVTYNK